MAKHLTATQLADFYICPLKAWNHYHRKEKRSSLSPLSELITKRGLLHEKSIIDKLDYTEVKLINGDFTEAFEETKRLMKEKTAVLYQPVLCGSFNEVALVGLPDLLIYDNKTDKYRVHEIKASLEISTGHIIQVSFYNYLLEQIDMAGDFHYVIPGSKKKEIIQTDEYKDFFKELLSKAISVILPDTAPLFCSGLICSDCQWRELCFATAKKNDSIGQIYSLREKELVLFHNNNINTLSQVLKMSKAIPFIPKKRLAILKKKTEALITKNECTTINELESKQKPIFFHIINGKSAGRYIGAAAFLLSDNTFLYFYDNNEKTLIENITQFLQSIDIITLIASCNHSLNILKDQILYPKQIGSGYKLQHVTSLENIAKHSLALSLPLYDYNSLLNHLCKIDSPLSNAEITFLKENGNGKTKEKSKEIMINMQQLYKAIKSFFYNDRNE